MAIVFTSTTDSTLTGTTNFLYSKTGGINDQGKGISYPFTIDQGMKGKVLQGTFDYRIDSGTYTSGDLTVWIYDVTNDILIQPAPTSIQNHSLSSEPFFFEFQTSSSSTSYRLIIHQTTVTTNNYTVRFDNFNISRQAKLYGSPVTDWVSYTPTGSWTTNTTYTGKWRRVGDSIELDINLALTGAPGGAASLASISIPSGLSIDTAKLTGTVIGTTIYHGIGKTVSAGIGYPIFVSSVSATTIRPILANASATYLADGGISTTAPNIYANTDYVNFNAKFPVVGWSSSVVMSSDAATNVVALSYYGVTTATFTGSYTDNILKYPTKSLEKGGITYSSSTGLITISAAGSYSLSAVLQVPTSVPNNTSTDWLLRVNKNSTTIADIAPYPTGTAPASVVVPFTINNFIFDAVAGDTIKISLLFGAAATQIAWTGSTTSLASLLNIQRISGPAQIAASDSVSARYTTAAGQSIAYNTVSIVDFGTKDFDSNSAVTTGASWKFTAPSSGKYSISAKVFYTTAFTAAGSTLSIGFHKNNSGTVTSVFITSPFLSGGNNAISLNDSIQLLAGETVDVRLYQNDTASTARLLDTTAARNTIAITRTGNY